MICPDLEFLQTGCATTGLFGLRIERRTVSSPSLCGWFHQDHPPYHIAYGWPTPGDSPSLASEDYAACLFRLYEAETDQANAKDIAAWLSSGSRATVPVFVISASETVQEKPPAGSVVQDSMVIWGRGEGEVFIQAIERRQVCVFRVGTVTGTRAAPDASQVTLGVDPSPSYQCPIRNENVPAEGRCTVPSSAGQRERTAAIEYDEILPSVLAPRKIKRTCRGRPWYYQRNGTRRHGSRRFPDESNSYSPRPRYPNLRLNHS